MSFRLYSIVLLLKSRRSTILIFLLFVPRNLSNLNLGGEISPSIGDLRNLQSMYGTLFSSSLA